MKNILIIEDWRALARGLKTLLETSGNQVTWLVGADSSAVVEGGVIIEGITAGGARILVDSRQYQLAFVDGQIEGELQGPGLVTLLSRSGIACCGMSTSSKINDDMLERGATLAAKKPVVFAALLSRQLSIDCLPKPSRTDRVRLTALETRFMKPDCDLLRHEAESFLSPFIKEDL